jgi:PilZ domain-containing protein
MSNDSRPHEQRRSPRRATFLGASLSHPRTPEPLHCVVRNISPYGALLESPLAKSLPLSFWLRLEGETEPHLCIIVWRSERQVGVEFSQQIIQRGVGRVAAVYGVAVNN